MKSDFIQEEAANRRESFGELLNQLAAESSALVRDEIQLAKQEMKEKLQIFRSGIITTAIGVILGFVALEVFCAALVLLLSRYMNPVLAAATTGSLLLLIGGGMAFLGIRLLKKTSMKPERTIRSLKEDKEWLKEMSQ
jgi:hypothetical protein